MKKTHLYCTTANQICYHRTHFAIKKCTKMHLQLGLCPRTRGWGAYSAPQLDLMEPLHNGMGGRRGGKHEEGMEKEGMEKGENGM